ncbi:hypothetical protein GCM10010274_46810 [Streptomyces lavendofoliae]|uniref:Uncharacterized protein n=1 Tax=Streptomyces lavendofoliae TaxID=67314 RepID=A0A918I0H2_9ACTN|nr:hypothetical protein GCM10010274_46810 [Streptomyces lavendofoliae]
MAVHRQLSITRQGLTVDSHELCVLDEPITVEHIADDLHVVRVAILVEQVDADDPAFHQDRTTTYSLPRSPLSVTDVSP